MDEGVTGSRGVEGVREGVEAKGMETGQMERVRETLETRQGQGTTRNGNVCCGRSLSACLICSTGPLERSLCLVRQEAEKRRDMMRI